MNRSSYETRFNTRDHISQKYKLQEKGKDEKKEVRETPQEKVAINREELKEVIIDILKELFPQLWEKNNVE